MTRIPAAANLNQGLSSQVQLTLPEHGDRPQPGPHGHEQDRARHGRQQRHRQGDRTALRAGRVHRAGRIPDLTHGEVAAKELVAEGYEAVAVQLEVTDDSSVRAAAGWIEETYGRLDVLVNNAAVILLGDDAVSRGAGRRTGEAFATNVIGLVGVTQAMLPLLRTADRRDEPVDLAGVVRAGRRSRSRGCRQS